MTFTLKYKAQANALTLTQLLLSMAIQATSMYNNSQSILQISICWLILTCCFHPRRNTDPIFKLRCYSPRQMGRIFKCRNADGETTCTVSALLLCRSWHSVIVKVLENSLSSFSTNITQDLSTSK